MSRSEYQYYDFYVEVESHEVDTMFKMTDTTLKECLINIKPIGDFKFNEFPEWHLRFLEVPGHIRVYGKSWRKYFIQYNTQSGKSRIIIGVPTDHSDNIPTESEMTKISPNRCSIYTERQLVFDQAETMIKNNVFWDQLKKLYIELTDLNTRIANLPKFQLHPPTETSSMSRTKYLKYKTKYINLKNNML